MPDDFANDVVSTLPDAEDVPPIRTDNPENSDNSGDSVMATMTSFDTLAEVSCTISATPGFEDGKPGYFMYVPYRAFFLDKETAQVLGAYFEAE